MREYRVVWKREGQQRRRKIYQTLAGAQHFATMVLCPPDEDPFSEDAPGPMWSDTSRAEWERQHAPYVEEPRIESREVGEWEPAQGKGARV